MKFRCEFDMDNAAFENPDEAARLLRKIADRVTIQEDSGNIRDINGNTVGTWEVTE